MADAVGVPDLYKLRSAMRAVSKDALTEVQATTKEAAEIVARQASANAPRGTRPLPKGRTKRLHEGFVATTSGARGLVRNKLPHAAIYEYRKTGTAAQMRGTRPVDRALEAKAGEVSDLLERRFDAMARRNGFR